MAYLCSSLSWCDMLIRNKYIERIKPFINKRLIKVLTGQRRVGKSVLLQTLAGILKQQNSDIQILYLDMEKYEFDSIKNYVDLMEYIKANKKADKIALFIDEIQGITEFEKALRSLYSDSNFDIYISGSNANLLSSELSTLLGGRYIEFEIHPFVYTEFLELKQIEDNDANFNSFLKFGGLPGLSDFEDNVGMKEEYLKNIYTSIIFRDVVRRNQIRNIAFLENLIQFVADNIGSLLSSTQISKYLKSQKLNISTNIVIEYLDYLCNAFIIRKVKRYDVKGKRMFEIGEKYYFEDLGIRNSIVGYRTTEVHKYLENVVFNHLKANGYNVKVGQIGSKEIDFVAEKNNEKKYIQVCYLLDSEKTIAREFGNLNEIKDNFEKIVLSLDAIKNGNSFEGIKNMSIRDFLISFE